MKHRVIGVSDDRSMQRWMNTMNLALIDAKIDLTIEQRERLWHALGWVVKSEGYVLTRQVSE